MIALLCFVLAVLAAPFKSKSRPEQIGDEHSKRVQDRKHHSQWCDVSALLCESRPDRIFGKDRTLRHVRATSALPPKADNYCGSRNVR